MRNPLVNMILAWSTVELVELLKLVQAELKKRKNKAEDDAQ
jgi:hypothetical protein